MEADPKVGALFDWLVDGCPGATTPMDVIARFGPELVAAGVPVDRIAAAVRTLHPHVAGRLFTWTPGVPVGVQELPWESPVAPTRQGSSVAVVFKTATEVRVRLDGGEPLAFAELHPLRAQGFSDYCAFPLNFMDGSIHSFSVATRRPGGFEARHLETLRYVLRPMCRVAETLALARTAANLLSAYVGRDAGDRILKGQVRRGDTEAIRCVVWFSDLRGFTSFSSERAPTEIIRVLNEFFECQVPSIESHGGQVLKFIGDGLLAIFPIDEAHPVAEVGVRAVGAAQEAFTALEGLNTARAVKREGPLSFGVALHVGDVAYGNIGGANRLDFTAIGPAVNLASRIEGLTGRLGKRLLLSAELTHSLPISTRELGSHEVKGVAQPVTVFEPV